MTNEIEKVVNKFINENKLTIIDYAHLKNVVNKLGYTVIEYNVSLNDNDVWTVINNLSLEDAVLQHNGFTVSNESYRLVFINEELNENEKLLVLAHEAGHIVCGHLEKKPVLGESVKDEYEANEFSHYLLTPNLLCKAKRFALRHKKTVISICIFIIVIIIASVAFFATKKQQSYYGEYYITDTGNRYHKKDCIFVKNKTNAKRFTKDEAASGEYSPCEICLPEE